MQTPSDPPASPSSSTPAGAAPGGGTSSPTAGGASPPATTAADGPGKVDSFLRRLAAGVSGLALVVGFFLPWQRATALDPISLTGLDIVTKGLLDPGARTAVMLVPALGLILLGLAYLGRRAALVGCLLVGLTLLLVGAVQTLQTLAQSIGTGLWVVAGASLLALVGGVPWRRVLRGALKAG